MYRVGFPFWKVAGRIGVPLLLRIEVAKDEEAGVFIAVSPDLQGLTVEAASLEELHREVGYCVDDLMEEILKKAPKAKPLTAWAGDVCTA